MEARMTHWHETQTKNWRTESQKKDSQSASSLLKLAAEAWLERHCANSSLHWNIRKRSLKTLSPIAQSLHWTARLPHCIRTYEEVDWRHSHRLRNHFTELRAFFTALEHTKKLIGKTLTDCAIVSLNCSRKVFLGRSPLIPNMAQLRVGDASVKFSLN